MPIAPPRIGTPHIGPPLNPRTGQPAVQLGLAWPQARAAALAGFPVRRAAWRKWLIYDPAVFTWIISEPVVTGSPARDPLRVARNFDFGAGEFRAADWTMATWADGDEPPAFPPTGPGPAAGIAEPGAATAVSPDGAVVRLELSLPLLDTEAVCLVGEGTTKLRVRATIVGGPTAVGTITLMVNEDSGTEVELPAWPGAEVVHDFEVEYAPGQEFEVDASYVNGATVDVDETIDVPGECMEITLHFTGAMTETSSPPEEYEDAEGYTREESYDFEATYQCAEGAGTKRARLIAIIAPPAVIAGTVTPPGTSYGRPIAPPEFLTVTLDGSNAVTDVDPASLGAFPPPVSSAYFERIVTEGIAES